MKNASLLLLALTMGLSAPLLHAQLVPGLISYQGKITDSSGVGLGDAAPLNRKMIFRIFNHPTASNPENRLWSEEQTVTLVKGDFSVILGQGIGANYNGSPEAPRPSLLTVFAGTDRYLELVVDSGDGSFTTADTPITPRQRLISTGFAVRAASADSVTAGTDLNLRDSNHGLGWYGTGKTFNGVNLDGPALYGFGGGILGTATESAKKIALQWNTTGNIGIGGAGPHADYKLDVAGHIHSSSDLFVDGKIGVETINPIAKLGIRSNGAPAMAFEFSGGGYRHFLQTRHLNNGSALGNAIDFYLNNSDAAGGSTTPGTGNTSALTIDAQGVGIGTTTPSAKLDVVGSLKVSGNSTIGGNGTFTGNLSASSLSATDVSVSGSGTFGNYSVGADRFLSIRSQGGNLYRTGINLKQFSDDYGWSLYSDERTVNGWGFHLDSYYGGTRADRLFVDIASGNVGIGTVTPGAKLEVNGSIKANGKNVPVAEEELRIVRGNVAKTVVTNFAANTTYPSPNGNLLKGSGYSFKRNADDEYLITFATPFTDTPSATFTPIFTAADLYDNATRVFVKIREIDTTKVIFRTNVDDGNSGHHCAFSFIIAGPR